MTELFEKQSRELDVEKRKQLVWELEKYSVPLVIKVILNWDEYRAGVSNQVKGYKQGSSGGGGYSIRHY